jgi:hypothetical protein
LNQSLELANQSLYSKLRSPISEREIIYVALLALIFISVYYIPPAIGLIINLMVAFYCYRSKYPLIIVFVFVMLTTRMNGMIDINKLPRISMAGNSVNLLDFLSFAMWIKVLNKSHIIMKSKFGTSFIMIYIVLILSAVINAVNSSVDPKFAINLIRDFSYYVCYFYFLISYKDISDFNFIIKALFIATFLVLANQIIMVVYNKPLGTLLFGFEDKTKYLTAKFTMYYGNYQSDKSRGISIDGVNPLMLLFSCLALLSICREKSMRNFMVLSVVLVIMSGLVEATRSYFVFYLLPFLAYIKNLRHIMQASKIVILTIVLMLIVFIMIGGFGFAYFHDIFLRLSGITKIINVNTRGQVETAVGRIEAAKVMMNVIVKSPIVGHGFSPFSRALDDDLGFLNTMIILGLAGLLIYVHLIIKFLNTCHSITRAITNNNPYKISVSVFMYAMIGLTLGYATTLDFFSSGTQNMTFIGIFLGMAEVIFKEAVKYEKLLVREIT